MVQDSAINKVINKTALGESCRNSSTPSSQFIRTVNMRHRNGMDKTGKETVKGRGQCEITINLTRLG